MWCYVAATLLKIQCSVKSKILIITRILSEYIATFSTKGTLVWWGKSTHLFFTICGMQLDSKGYPHHAAVMPWLLCYRCGYCHSLSMCVHVLWVLLCFVWEWSFIFYVSTSKSLEINWLITWGQGLECSDRSMLSYFCLKQGKIRHKCSLTSIKLCNTAHQRAEFLVIQKCSSCVLPNPVLGPRLGELVLNGCPRISYPDQL